MSESEPSPSTIVIASSPVTDAWKLITPSTNGPAAGNSGPMVEPHAICALPSATAGESRIVFIPSHVHINPSPSPPFQVDRPAFASGLESSPRSSELPGGP